MRFIKFRDEPNDLLAGEQKGRAEKLVAEFQSLLRPPFLPPEAGR